MHWWLVVLAAAACGGAAVAISPLMAGAATGAAAVVVLVIHRPEWAGYIYLGLTPLIVGLQRGMLIPVIRLNEALLGLLCLAVVLGSVRRWALAGFPRLDVRVVDLAVLGLALFSSVTSLLWMYARAVDITADDILFALTLWKYGALYLLFRITIRSEAQVRRAILVALLACVPVAVLGVLQAVGVGPVLAFLVPFATDEGPAALANNRASSTIGAPIPFGDVMVMVFALALGWLTHVRAHRLPMAAIAALFGISAVASGQVSSWLGLLVAGLVIGWAMGRLRHAVAGIAVLGAASAIALQPVISARVPTGGGVPTAWTGEDGRIGNLSEFIWPRIGEGVNWLFGVRTSARIPAPEVWREWVWIESGYTWLMWNGGLPLTAAFVVFAVSALKVAQRVVRDGTPAFRAVGLAALGVLAMEVVLMVVDPHLTMRGAADLLFPMIALCVNWHLGFSRTATSAAGSGAPPPFPGPGVGGSVNAAGAQSRA
ncbi:hypothetical protein DQ241_17675 [Blastococcus sp. TF02A-30]|nr:hypothetical protein DQ241_17675 [Blastococcus sp. TF02A-30]